MRFGSQRRKNRREGDFISKENVVESAYSIIENCKGKRITTKQIEEAIGSQHKARYAIKKLLKENRIKRIRLLGVNRIEYSYKIVRIIQTKNNKKNSNNNITNYNS